MNLILQPNQFNQNCIYFLERKSNMIIDGLFSKLLYSTDCFITTGLYIDFLLEQQTFKKSGSSTIEVDIHKNTEMIQQLINIEKEILLLYIEQFQLQTKIPVYDLENKLQSTTIKFYSSNIYNKPNNYKLFTTLNYYIKISGIWETNQQIGLTYKIIEYQTK